MIVLGIDPGIAILGYGVVERCGGSLRAIDVGAVATSPDLPLGERLHLIHTAVVDLIELHRPTLVAIERLFFTRNVQSAFAVGQSRGVVLLAAAQAGLDVREATPSQVKTAVAGYGAADKEQVGRMVATILRLDCVPTPDDAADALAVAICIANLERPGERLNAGVLDRSAIAPIVRGETPYNRAVREAIARDTGTRPAATVARGSVAASGAKPAR